MVSSSTKLSSDRRSVATSSLEVARNARGYTLPLCGELNTTGPRHSSGSSVSKGGSNSSFSSDMRSASNRSLEKRAECPLEKWTRPGPQEAPLSLETRYCPWGQRRMPRPWEDPRMGSPDLYPAPRLWGQGKQGCAGDSPAPSTGWKMAKIILAEDDNDMRRFLVKALQNAGYDVISFDNGLSAYQRLREEPFELLLTDIVMPEMDGIELARRASELDPDMKIMFITGFAAVALNADSTAPKHAKVLSKPIHLRDLVNEVQKMLAVAA